MLDNIRYVHFNSKFHKWNGFTIAYSRMTDNVIFAVSLVKYTDQYDKAIGRLVSTQRLETVGPDINATDDYFDTDNLVGNITMSSVESMCDAFQMNSVLADQSIAKLNMMDFKHSFLSQVLLELVTNEIK